jgi:hypothetical protein
MNRRTLLAAAALPFAGRALAQPDFPSRPLNMVVAFPPGGQADLAARPTAAAMERILGQPVVVQNRGGAAGAIGNAFVARSAPDGYTTLMALSSLAVIPEAEKLFGRTPPYTADQFAPIAWSMPIPPCSPYRPARRGRRWRSSSPRRRHAPATSPTAPPAPTARCMWRWRCCPPRPASVRCTCRSAAPARRSRRCSVARCRRSPPRPAR